MNNKEIAKKLDTSAKVVSRWVSKYVNNGIESLCENNYKGNHRNMSSEAEEEFLESFFKHAKKGEIVEVSEIKKAYVEKIGHDIGNEQIYFVLKRHGWRKIMPRSRHPKKADKEAIDASKKLTKL